MGVFSDKAIEKVNSRFTHIVKLRNLRLNELTLGYAWWEHCSGGYASNITRLDGADWLLLRVSLLRESLLRESLLRESLLRESLLWVYLLLWNGLLLLERNGSASSCSSADYFRFFNFRTLQLLLCLTYVS